MFQDLLLNLFGQSASRVYPDPYAPLAEPANAVYCEQPTHTWIERPGYAISNIPFMLLGLVLLAQKSKLAQWFGISSLFIGACSLVYDVTFTHAAQYFDWLGMFLFVNGLLSLNILRLTKRPKRAMLAYVGLLLIYLPLSYITDAGTEIFGVVVALVLITELYMYFSSPKSYSISLFLAGLAVFLIGWGIWQFDSHQAWCDPTNLFNGRGIFHYLTTVTIFLLYKHYSRVKITG